MNSYRTHKCWELTSSNIWETIKLSWWVNTSRDHWWVIFIDLRDRYWITQIKVDPATTESQTMSKAKEIKSEYVIQVEGKVSQRPEWTINSNISTWKIEIIPENIKILSESKHPPFEVADEHFVREETRMKYRYLDLRREQMQKNIKARNQITSKIFDSLKKEDFMYIETPFLIKNTPEWAREYIVPSRHSPGKSYVLPQSPQQLKQILMISGFDKYFQIAKCFRDEDLRGDRQPEFTQIDLEMSFVEENDIISLTEKLMKDIVSEIYPEKQILENPFPQIQRENAMNKYWVDNPETRIKNLEITDISEIAQKSDLKVFKDVVSNWGVVKGMLVDKTFTRWEIDKFTKLLQEKWAKWLAYIIWDEEGPKSPILKFFSEETQKELFEKMWAKEWTTIFFQATEWLEAVSYLGYLRTILIKEMNLTESLSNELWFTWIKDFPLFEIDEDSGKLTSSHHPFTQPQDKYLPLIKEISEKLQKWEKLNQEDKNKLLEVKAKAYDLVLNWNEIAGGSIRISDINLQNQIFTLLWISKEETQERFWHMLEAFQYWVPPHWGIAIWFDRLVMLLQNMSNIREIIPFPKTQKWEDLMLSAPTGIDENLLKELWLKII